jgi:hypothetical protein
MFDVSGVGLEIGPSYNPVVPKSTGAKIETIDYTDQAGLIQKYKSEPSVDIRRIEPVDYVSDGKPMTCIIRRRDYYDYIIASHVIEHTPNMISFINDCRLLLKDRGVLVLAIPDRRYCFDYFRPITSTGDVLQAFREGRTRHTPGALFDHLAYVSRRGGQITWSKEDLSEFEFVHTLDQAAAFFESYSVDAEYVDCHAWQFTPSSFRLIVKDLSDIRVLHLREHKFHDSIGFEFFATLSAHGAGAPIDRLTLAKMAQEEAALAAAPRRPLAEPLPRVDDGPNAVGNLQQETRPASPGPKRRQKRRSRLGKLLKDIASHFDQR